MELKFKPTENVMDSLRMSNISYVKGFIDHKLELLMFCMDEFNKDESINKYMTPLFKIKCGLLSIIDGHKNKIKKEIYDEWKNSKDGVFTINLYNPDSYLYDCKDLRKVTYNLNYDELEDKLNHYIEQLMLMHIIVKTPDYFDENEKFYDKLNNINQLLDDFYWEAQSIAINDVVETYKTFIVQSEDSETDEE